MEDSSMGLIHIMEKGGDEARDFKKAVKMAKKAIDIICELTDEMEDKYSERSMSKRRGPHKYERDDYDYDY